jgi:hypothetical protein
VNFQVWYQWQLRLIQTMCAEQPIAFVALTSGVHEKLYVKFSHTCQEEDVLASNAWGYQFCKSSLDTDSQHRLHVQAVLALTN